MKTLAKPSAATLPRTANDLRGLGRLAIDGVTGVTDLVEAMHAAITHLPSVVGKPAPASTTGLTGMVYRSVRGVTRLVGAGMDRSLTSLGPMLDTGDPSPQREALLAAMNGVLGDHLESSGNPLAIAMQFRRHGQSMALTRSALRAGVPEATGKLLVLVHGLCMNDQQWNQAGHDHGRALHRELDYTPVYLHYNSGRHVSTNGGDFARLLRRLVREWPVPVQEITFLCHSMGGLVTRSALEEGFRRSMPWSELPIRVVFLGTPHHGAPLERAGSWADLLIGLTPYSAPFVRLGKVRSAGIQDLRHGNVRDTDWQDRDGDGRADGRSPLPLPAGVAAYAIAVTTQQRRGDGDDARLRGDGLVPIASALGEHADRDFDLRIPRSRRWVGHGINHLELLASQAVYRRVARWLASDC
ncbi:MAG: alpha/beta hydrolase [Lysobacteraceae bacterium]|nr:MAG: alpha/beta hydrolase [Xanthomonadaceae bacterium]